ncbi:helix-turn-helix domain-containing protein [Streptomyces xanthophaeus]|uniref:helix-turn-helix domain-containing protein n=1 Tax=Streptomyces xanthophaeus TaxID=67385 RepID=UPI00343575AE
MGLGAVVLRVVGCTGAKSPSSRTVAVPTAAESARSVVVDVQQLAEYRYRAVREVLGGSPIGEVAARYGTSRQTLHSWRRRFEQEGMPGLPDRSRRPRTSPLACPPRWKPRSASCAADFPGGRPPDLPRVGRSRAGVGAVAGHGPPGAVPQRPGTRPGKAASAQVPPVAARAPTHL